MASSTFAIVLFVIALTFPTSHFAAHISSSSFTALNQLKYWSENVQGTMPGNLLSKLSPLSKEQDEHFTSLVSKKNLPFDANLCSLANLACLSKARVDSFLDKNNYGYGRISPNVVLHVDPFSFFRLSLLKQGNMVHLSSLENQLPQQSFLPSQTASKISVTENDLRKLFPQSFESPQTKDAIQYTLIYCNTPALKEEPQSCAKSLEEMIEFSKTAIGDKNMVALASKNTEGSRKELMVGRVEKLKYGKTVACHQLFLPFATYFCHLLSNIEVYAVDVVEPRTKVPVNTVTVVCHMDTSGWSPDHVALKILKTSPGQSEACHWMSQSDLIFISQGKN
ncbi:BURP domain-containing protein 16-like [Coffea eugenioides]|uniref:BURP domain-containing protein 16-like n=1 Tax=Coffea eugenioides TaxID=49369 RepID=UPI000F60763F|nr:BURP domain-containing protein 16-like [Coffea eugenioides]